LVLTASFWKLGVTEFGNSVAPVFTEVFNV
jgi:hypothetical protein